MKKRVEKLQRQIRSQRSHELELLSDGELLQRIRKLTAEIFDLDGDELDALVSKLFRMSRQEATEFLSGN
jgi:uncharacterized small protein (DUF1192 family)